jgi:hypothetical protein
LRHCQPAHFRSSYITVNRPTALNAADNWDSHWGDFDEVASANPAQIMRHSFAIWLFLAEQRRQTGNFVDIGSGQGDFLRKFHQQLPGMKLLGLELSQTGVEHLLGECIGIALRATRITAIHDIASRDRCASTDYSSVSDLPIRPLLEMVQRVVPGRRDSDSEMIASSSLS